MCALIGYCLYREGRAGGYKELDEAELEETKRRRREAEEVSDLTLAFNFRVSFMLFVQISRLNIFSTSG